MQAKKSRILPFAILSVIAVSVFALFSYATQSGTSTSAAVTREGQDVNGVVGGLENSSTSVQNPNYLTVSSVSAWPSSTQSGGVITVRAVISNHGDVAYKNGYSQKGEFIFVLQHTTQTTNPTVGGKRVGPALVRGIRAQGSESIRSEVRYAPPVSSSQTFYYYVCVTNFEQPVNCSETPATVTVHPAPAPKLSLSNVQASVPATCCRSSWGRQSKPPLTVQVGKPVTLQVTVSNLDTAINKQPITFFRHTTQTNHPETGGTRIINTTTEAIPAGAQTSKTIVTTVPPVSLKQTFYYYACVTDTSVCSKNPADVTVISAVPSSPEPNTNQERSEYGQVSISDSDSPAPVGGDSMYVQHEGRSVSNHGIITLGGVETVTGERGFIVPGNAVMDGTINNFFDPLRNPLIYTTEYAALHPSLVGHTTRKEIGHAEDGTPTTFDDGNSIKHLLGRVLLAPRIQRGYDGGHYANVNAAFVVYPHAPTPHCLTVWRDGNRAFCLDLDASKYIDRVAPLTVHGKDGKVHNVIGSREPDIGLIVQFDAGSARFSEAEVKHHAVESMFAHTAYFAYANDSRASFSESGTPVYTVPDENGDVYIVGVVSDGTKDGILFSSWSDIAEEFNLKPIEQTVRR